MSAYRHKPAEAPVLHPGLQFQAGCYSGGTGLGFRSSSVATKVKVASVTLLLMSSVRLRRQASTRMYPADELRG